MRRVLRDVALPLVGIAVLLAVVAVALSFDPLMDRVTADSDSPLAPTVLYPVFLAGAFLAAGASWLAWQLTAEGRRSRVVGGALRRADPVRLRAELDRPGVRPGARALLVDRLLDLDMAAGHEELAQDAARFLAAARAGDLDEGLVRRVVHMVAGNEAESLLFGRDVPALLPGETDEARLSEAERLLVAVSDGGPDPALGILRLAQGRPREARELLDVRLPRRAPAYRASVAAIQAVVAHELGEPAEAARLLAEARVAAGQDPDAFVAATVRDAGAWIGG